MAGPKETKVHPLDVQNFPGMFFAVLIDAGLIVEWPLAWTKRGRAVVRRFSDDKGYDAIEVVRFAISTLPASRFGFDGPGMSPGDVQARTKLRRCKVEASQGEIE